VRLFGKPNAAKSLTGHVDELDEYIAFEGAAHLREGHGGIISKTQKRHKFAYPEPMAFMRIFSDQHI
jgi:hypothetical protein